MIGFESLPATYDDAVETDARRIQNAGSNAATDHIPQYMIEKGWFDKFTSFKSSIVSNVHGSHPEKINNSLLLATQGVDNKEDPAPGGVIPMSEDSNSDDEERRRQMRRKKWRDKKVNFEPTASGSQKTPELLGGNTDSGPLSLRPNLRHQTDYVLVGEKTWNVITKHFSHDVEIPRTLYYTERKGSCDSNLGIKEGEKKGLVVDIYPEKESLNDKCRVAVPPSGRWDLTNEMKESGDSDEKRQSMSDLISEGEGSNPGEGGDDLFPSLEDEPNSAAPQCPQSPTPASQLQIVPFDQAKATLGDLYAKRSKPAEIKSDVDTSDDDAVSPVCDDQEEVRSTPSKRKRATGLGNLGNTCFMNSTLQCLAHTAPLREYFTSGDFEKDLNKDNPLGTGGELATEFACLLRQMWGIKNEEKSGAKKNGEIYSSSRVYSPGNYDSGLSSVTYPRAFKHTLGRHAEQFMGYDQHDSQELAIYLLDALHEDTNRVTKKPYIEKPEQAEDESDDAAAEKAWSLNLQREDSRILENFMGQIKSRLTCPVSGCGRVSTTFDPFMYLSVPIPGAMDKIMKVTFVPLSSDVPCADLTVKLNKMSTVSDLRKHVAALARECYQFSEDELLEEDITIADMWSGEVYKFYKDTDEVDKIRDRDITHAYQLRPLSAVRKEASISREQEKNSTSQFDSEDTVGVSTLLDTDTLNELDRTWQNKLEEFVQQPMSLYRLTNETRSSKEDKIDFYRKLISFIQRCRKCSDSSAETTGSGGKTMLESNDKLDKISKTKTKKVEEVESPLMLEEQSQMSSTFKNVRTPHDLAVLEYCASKYKSFINSSSAKKKSLNDDGIRVQVVFKKHASTPNGHNAKSRSSWKTVGTAIAMRLPPTLTVSDFRRELGQRISKALKIENEKSSSHSEASFASNGSGPDKLKSSFTSMTPETAILNQVALSYDSKSVSNQNYASSEVIGTVTDEQLISDAAIFAKSTDKEEQELIAEFVEEKGKIFVGWPTRLSDSFDEDALWVKEEFLSEDQKREREQSLENKVTVMECISKYCQIEQLEKSEMWYCNRCKDHVQAWKKFCLYRAPPILIIHLKRFHFSSSTHRRDKIDTLIDFPLKDLDLRDLVMHSEEGKEPIYDCYAVSNHFGGLGGGHYTAYAKGDDGIWSNFDDSRVTSDIDEGDVVSNAAYCLYYKRKDVDFSNDKEIDDLTQGMESGRAMVGSSDDAASHDDMEIETSNHSPSLVSFNENQTDDMDGDSNTMLLDTNETHNYPPQ